MRKILFLSMFLIFALGIPILAIAEEAGVLPDTFFSWESIGTFAGAVAAVVFIVQLFKLPLDRVPTKYVVYVVSVGVLLLAQTFVPSLGGLTLQSGLLCLINGGLVALAAMSTYEVTIKEVQQKAAAEQLTAAQEFTSTLELNDDEIQKIATLVAAKMKETTSSTGT